MMGKKYARRKNFNYAWHSFTFSIHVKGALNLLSSERIAATLWSKEGESRHVGESTMPGSKDDAAAFSGVEK